MKKLKLFPKTFLYTLCLMFVIILISHFLIYLLLPVVYNYHQRSNLEKEVTALLQNITEGKESDRLALVTDFASKWCANITVETDFLRAASHELKTPVTAVNVMLENMIFGVGKYKDRDTYLAKCKILPERLTSMIKEILDTLRLDAYSNQEMVDLDLADTVISACEPFRVIAKSNGVKLNVDMSASFHIHFVVGRLEILKVFSQIFAVSTKTDLTNVCFAIFQTGLNHRTG